MQKYTLFSYAPNFSRKNFRRNSESLLTKWRLTAEYQTIKRQKKFFIFFRANGRALHSLGAKLRILHDSHQMKNEEFSRFMPKNMFSNFRYHLIVPFVKICDIHASIPAIIRKYWSSSTLLKPIICYGSMVLKQLHLIRAMSVQTECRATRAGSKELCWGEAWLHKVNAVQERDSK